MDRVYRRPGRDAQSPTPRLPPALLALFLALMLGGCGAPEGIPGDPAPSGQESGLPSPAPSSPSNPTSPSQESAMASPVPSSSVPSADSATLLTVEIRQSEGAEPVGYVLECSGDTPGPNTTLPNAARACATVQRLGANFFNALPDANVACTQQYGGPQTASISGMVDGTQVRARFALTDGCEISRWNAVRSILGSGGAV